MLTHPTIDKLTELHLDVMAQALAEQRGDPSYEGLAFEERLGLLVDRELTARENRRMARYLKSARLRVQAAVEDIDFRRQRGLDRAQFLGLAQCAWVEQHRSVMVVGPTGVGKTYLSCALAHAAIVNGHTALYLRAPRLFDEITIARADGRLKRMMAAWAKVGVLVIDDFLLRPLTPDQAADLLEVIEDRSGIRSTVITSQLPVDLWHEALGDATIADAVLDRLLEKSHRVELSGESLRRDADGAPPATNSASRSTRKRAS